MGAQARPTAPLCHTPARWHTGKMSKTDMKIGVIGDEDTVTGMLLAGVGHVDGQGKKNFMMVDSKTHQKAVEEKFNELTTRKDIAMIMITQSCANDIRYAV